VKPLWLALAIIALNAVACAVAVKAGGRRPERFFEESTFTTWLSAMQILGIAAFAVAIYVIRQLDPNARGRSHRFWILVAIGAAFFAMDEIFQYHEGLAGYLIDVQKWPQPRIKLDDLFVAGYGAVALLVCWVHRRDLPRDRRVLTFFAAGLVLLVVSQAIDTFGPHKRTAHWLWVPEESSKTLGFATILGGFILQLESALLSALAWSARPAEDVIAQPEAEGERAGRLAPA